MLIGFHPHQLPPANEGEFRKLRNPSETVLDIDAGGYINAERDFPGKWWTVRLYTADQPGRVPEELAGAVIAEAEKWRALLGNRVWYQYANEINLGIEWGNNEGLQPWLESDDGFKRRLDIHMRVVKSVKQRAPWIQLAGPYDSPGHQDVDGRVEVALLAQAGYFDYVDAYGGHFYAEGPDRGGFDQPDKEWYGDRVLKVRALLDVAGYAHLPIFIGETNRKQIDIGDAPGEFERYCERIAGAVARIDWFVWSSGNPTFQDFALWRLPNIAARYQAIIDRFAGAIPAPAPTSTPEVPPVTPAPPQPTSPAIAVIEARYGISHTDAPGVYLAELIERPDPANITAFTPEGLAARIATKDWDPVTKRGYMAEGTGRVDLPFSHPAAYIPSKGERGFYYAEAEGARVDGLGWALLDGDHASHRNVAVVFARRPVVSPPTPVEPPAPEPTDLDQRRLELSQYAVWANALIHIEPEPTLNMVRDVDRFIAHLAALGVPEPTNIRRYGFPG